MQSRLFTPVQLKSITLKNRLVVSPMCQYTAVDGFANDWHLVHLGSRAVGGAGLIIVEATAVSPEGRISPMDLGIWDDNHIEKLRQITSFIQAQDSVAGIQIAHAGRKASTYPDWLGSGQVPHSEGGWQTVSSSPLPFYPDEETPEALDLQGIRKVIDDFKSAARRSLEAGFSVLEIHAAHGYLIHQFLSPISNKRTDEYGGGFENRIRLLLEILAEIQEVWPAELPIFVRISATDWVESGWNLEESTRLSQILQQAGVTLIDVSSGGLVPDARIPLAPAYQVPFATHIKREAGIMTGAVGLIDDAGQAEEILVKEEADLIFVGRELLRNPYFPLQAAKELDTEIAWPKQYGRARK